MVEENRTPGEGEGARAGGPGAQGSGRRIEGDLLAERRALRAAESGEAALVRRAEAAEATVQTLERHVLSLQARLGEAEEERVRLAEVLEAERTVAVEREHELRRVKQREYAEQQQRVEAEDRLTLLTEQGTRLDREGRAEMQELGGRLSASERDAQELAARLETLRRELAEAEQAAAAERAALRHAEGEVQARLAALEGRAIELERGLGEERAARERSERALELMRQGHRQMEGLVGEMKEIVAHLTVAMSAREAVAPTVAYAEQAPATEAALVQPLGQAGLAGSGSAAAAQARAEEMATALAAAVERLRARAEAAPAVAPQAPTQSPVRVPHKHSMSLIGRWRFRRKQRRGR